MSKGLKQSTIQWFFWVINLALFIKDESICMDTQYLTNLTYRQWNLISCIIIVAQYVILLPVFNFKIK